MNRQQAGKCTVVFKPSGRSAAVRRGVTLLEAARTAGVSLTTRCGGKAGCLMCKVAVDPTAAEALSSPGEAERRKLGPLLESGTRLACQAALKADVTVTVPEDPLKAAVRRRLEEAAKNDDSLW